MYFVLLSEKGKLHKAIIIIYVDVHTMYKDIICMTIKAQRSGARTELYKSKYFIYYYLS